MNGIQGCFIVQINFINTILVHLKTKMDLTFKERFVMFFTLNQCVDTGTGKMYFQDRDQGKGHINEISN